MNKFSIILILCLLKAFSVSGQEHANTYIAPDDPLVIKQLEKWSDLKFGIFMHWGTYSQWGIVESWSLCPEDEGWTKRYGAYSGDYYTYKNAYENLQKTFNPVDFDPNKWAKAAWDAGFRYMVFTMKHHDGFCMFDSEYTDYKITSPNTPFSSNPRANIGKEINEAFRQQGFMIGSYFSKPDWHCEYYWWPYFPPKDRNVNYDPKKYPDKWRQYKEFTYKQIEELLTDQGKVDILWLDGGWVRPYKSINPSIEWQKTIPYDQDIDMASIASMGRHLQPGLIVVDRSVGGEYENYQTPEQEIPAKPLDYPWETCMTMATSWSYVPGDKYKPAYNIIHNLIDIVAKGGNYLLNIGPSPMGDYDSAAYTRLKEIGDWMKVNGSAIYGTRPIAPYKSGNICFTQCKDLSVNAIYLAGKNETVIPATVSVLGIIPSKGAKIQMPGYKSKLSWKMINDELIISIPPDLRLYPPSRYAWVFNISSVEK
jgi:alpha-L-fucosidase